MTPARIKFPVIEDVSKYTVGIVGRAIILVARPIKPAVIDNKYPAPTHCRVQGVLLENGNPIELIVSLVELHAMRNNAVVFVEDDNGIPAPSGAVLDYMGHITNHRRQVEG